MLERRLQGQGFRRFTCLPGAFASSRLWGPQEGECRDEVLGGPFLGHFVICSYLEM